MKTGTRNQLLVALGLAIWLLSACSLHTPRRPLVRTPVAEQLTDSEQIAGEIMAYLMEVVLGRAGAPEKRLAWSTRGLNLPLDFNLVSKRMFGPVPLRSELMVLDTNILGLSEVLYHYDRRLNLFKGTREHDSLYPSVELMAIRLFLVHKLNRGEAVSLAGMLRYQALFTPGSRDAQPMELAAMSLSDTEFKFLKAVFQSEPAFLRYMQHPFLISTLRRLGVVEQDALTLSAGQLTHYRRWACPPRQPLPSSGVTIAILPSMSRLFAASPGLVNAVTPTREYQTTQNHLKQAILQALNRKYPAVGQADSRHQPAFFTPERPMVIHPDNAGRVIADICPRADFTVILLGKNVYRAIDIDPENDIFPHQKRIYLDISDIQHQEIDTEIDSIVDAILPELSADAADPVVSAGRPLSQPSPRL